MILSRIIIVISAKDIYISYVKDSEDAYPSPLPGYVWPMSLNKFGGPKAMAPDFAIGRACDEKMNAFSVPGSELDNIFAECEKAALPVVVIAENDVPDSGIESIVSNLSRWGYDNVKVTRPDVIATDYYNANYNFENIITASSNGADLSVSIFSKSVPGAIVRKAFEGRAVDNRVDSVANIIWDQVKNLTFDLKINTELDALRECAESFLKNPIAYHQGNIRLSDGDVYTYILRYKDLSTLPVSVQPIEEAVTDFLLDHDIADRSKTAIIIRNDAIGNHYLKEALTKSFQTVAYEEGGIKDVFAKYIASREWDKISGNPDRDLVNVQVIIEPPIDYPIGGGSKPIGGTQVGKEPLGGKPIDDEPGKGPDPQPESPVKEFIPVKLFAKIETEGGFFKKKKTLVVTIEPPTSLLLPWDSVLCVQEDPMTTIDPRNVMKEFEAGRKGPFVIKLPLPLSQCPNAKKLRVYFKPAPYEKIGINNAYDHEPLTITIK